jgi:hypothetical protein
VNLPKLGDGASLALEITQSAAHPRGALQHVQGHVIARGILV